MDVRVEAVRHVDATSSVVWQVLTDLEGSAEVLSGVTSIERLAGTAHEVGTRWRETRTMMGMQASEVMEVVAIDPEHHLQIAAESHGMSYQTVFTVVPRGRGALVHMTFHGASADSGLLKRTAGLITAPLGRMMTRSMMRQDLRDLAAEAERRALL